MIKAVVPEIVVQRRKWTENMAWETRRGKQYYYRSHRLESGRVRKEYCGTGLAAMAAAKADEDAREARQQERDTIRQIEAEMRPVKDLMNSLEEGVRLLMAGTLLAAGYHNHRGHWRKRRDGEG